jgi:hypothetical protein
MVGGTKWRVLGGVESGRGGGGGEGGADGWDSWSAKPREGFADRMWQSAKLHLRFADWC